MASSWWFNTPCLWKIIWGYHSWPPAFHGEVHYFALTSLTSWMRSVPLETSMPRVNALTFAIGCTRLNFEWILNQYPTATRRKEFTFQNLGEIAESQVRKLAEHKVSMGPMGFSMYLLVHDAMSPTWLLYSTLGEFLTHNSSPKNSMN